MCYQFTLDEEVRVRKSEASHRAGSRRCVRRRGGHRLQRIATLSNQETSVLSKIQNNVNALLASEAVLQGKYLALHAQKEALLSAGRVSRARQVAMQQGQVLNVEISVQGLIVAERGVATPIR